MIIVRAAPKEHYGWLAERACITVHSNLRAIEAIGNSDRILGMVGYDSWTPNSVHVSVAIDSPICLRRLIVPCFEYPFIQAKRGLIVCAVKSSNSRSISLVRRLGFRETYRVVDAWDIGDDMVIFEMRKEDCSWLSLSRRKAA